MEPRSRPRRKEIALALAITVIGLALWVGLVPTMPAHGSGDLPSFPDATVEYSVTFEATGLPAGTSWSVTFNGTSQSSSSSVIVFEEPDGAYVFTVAPVAGYSVSPMGNLTVDGSPVSEGILFTPIAVDFPVTFVQSGLPPGLVWSITLAGLTKSTNSSSSLSFLAPNGTYEFAVGPTPGYTSPATGNVSVSGAAVTCTVRFAPAAFEYSVTFRESGLPSGAAWSVFLNGQWQSANAGVPIAFAEPNGTYAFTVVAPDGAAASPGAGNVTVAGVPVIERILFAPMAAEFGVTFSLSGLPAGLVWSVSLGGVTRSANTSSAIAFSEPNGTYAFTVGSIPGYTTPPVGNVTVSGASVNETITFMPLGASGPANAPARSTTSSGFPTMAELLIGLLVLAAGVGAIAVLRRRP